MARKREKSEVEHLKGELRQIKKELDKARREVSRLSKRQQRVEELEELVLEDVSSPVSEEFSLPKCAKCSSSDLRSISLGIRTIIICDSCNHRETKK